MKEEYKGSITDQVKKEQKETPFQWYESIMTDCIYKMTIATVLFFTSYPWAALFWLPYYFTKRRKE